MAALSSGTSPYVTTIGPSSSLTASSATRTAWPVPLGLSWTHGLRGRIDLGKVRLDAVAAVPDDDDQVLGVEGSRGDQRVAEKAAAGDLVQHLGRCGTHPGAFAGGEHDDGSRPA